jgi:archaellum biogenesis ATPase FlaH
MGGEDHIKICHSAETMEAIEGAKGIVGVQVEGSEWSKEEEEELLRMMMDEERTARAEQAH